MPVIAAPLEALAVLGRSLIVIGMSVALTFSQASYLQEFLYTTSRDDPTLKKRPEYQDLPVSTLPVSRSTFIFIA